MKLKLKDPGSAITHGIAMLLAIAGTAPLIIKAARQPDTLLQSSLTLCDPNDYSPPGSSRIHGIL